MTDRETLSILSRFERARRWIEQTFCHSVRIQFDAPWNQRQARRCF